MTLTPFLGKNPDNIEFTSNYSNYEHFHIDPLKFIIDLYSTEHIWGHTSFDLNDYKESNKIEKNHDQNLEKLSDTAQYNKFFGITTRHLHCIDNDIWNNASINYNDPITELNNQYMSNILYTNPMVYPKDNTSKSPNLLKELEWNFSLFSPDQYSEKNNFWSSLNPFYMMDNNLFSKTHPFLPISPRASKFKTLLSKYESIFDFGPQIKAIKNSRDPKNDSLSLQEEYPNKVKSELKFNDYSFINNRKNFEASFRKFGRNTYYFKLEQMARLENAFLKSLFYRNKFHKTSILKNYVLRVPLISSPIFYSVNNNNKILFKTKPPEKINQNFTIGKKTRFLFGFHLNVSSLNWLGSYLTKIQYPLVQKTIRNRVFSSLTKYQFPSIISSKKIMRLHLSLHSMQSRGVEDSGVFFSKKDSICNPLKNSLWPLKLNIKNGYQKVYQNNFNGIFHEKMERIYNLGSYFDNTFPNNFLNQHEPIVINNHKTQFQWPRGETPYQNNFKALKHNSLYFLSRFKIPQNIKQIRTLTYFFQRGRKRAQNTPEAITASCVFSHPYLYHKSRCASIFKNVLNTETERLFFLQMQKQALPLSFWTPNFQWESIKKPVGSPSKTFLKGKTPVGMPVSITYDFIISRYSSLMKNTPLLETKELEKDTRCAKWWRKELWIKKDFKKWSQNENFPAVSLTRLVTKKRLKKVKNPACEMMRESFSLAQTPYKLKFVESFSYSGLSKRNKQNSVSTYQKGLWFPKFSWIEKSVNSFFWYRYDSKVNLNVFKTSALLNFEKHCFSSKPNFATNKIFSNLFLKEWLYLKSVTDSQINKEILVGLNRYMPKFILPKIKSRPFLSGQNGKNLRAKQELNSLALLGFDTTQIEFFGSLKIYAKRKFLEIFSHTSQNFKNKIPFLFKHIPSHGYLSNSLSKIENLSNKKNIYVPPLESKCVYPTISRSDINNKQKQITFQMTAFLDLKRTLETFIYDNKKTFSWRKSTHRNQKNWTRSFYNKVIKSFIFDSFSNTHVFLPPSGPLVRSRIFNIKNTDAYFKEFEKKTSKTTNFLKCFGFGQNKSKVIILPWKKLQLVIKNPTLTGKNHIYFPIIKLIKYWSINNTYSMNRLRLCKLIVPPQIINNLKHFPIKRHQNMISYAYAIETIQNNKPVSYSISTQSSVKNFESEWKNSNDMQSLSSKISCFSYFGYDPINSLNLNKKPMIKVSPHLVCQNGLKELDTKPWGQKWWGEGFNTLLSLRVLNNKTQTCCDPGLVADYHAENKAMKWDPTYQPKTIQQKIPKQILLLRSLDFSLLTRDSSRITTRPCFNLSKHEPLKKTKKASMFEFLNLHIEKSTVKRPIFNTKNHQAINYLDHVKSKYDLQISMVSLQTSVPSFSRGRVAGSHTNPKRKTQMCFFNKELIGNQTKQHLLIKHPGYEFNRLMSKKETSHFLFKPLNKKWENQKPELTSIEGLKTQIFKWGKRGHIFDKLSSSFSKSHNSNNKTLHYLTKPNHIKRNSELLSRTNGNYLLINNTSKKFNKKILSPEFYLSMNEKQNNQTSVFSSFFGPHKRIVTHDGIFQNAIANHKAESNFKDLGFPSPSTKGKAVRWNMVGNKINDMSGNKRFISNPLKRNKNRSFSASFVDDSQRNTHRYLNPGAPYTNDYKGNTNYYACISQITSWGSDHGSWILFLKYIRANIYKGDQLLPSYFNKMNFQMMPRTGSIMLQQLLSQLTLVPKISDYDGKPNFIEKQNSDSKIDTWQNLVTNIPKHNAIFTRKSINKTDQHLMKEQVTSQYFHYSSSFFSSQAFSEFLAIRVLDTKISTLCNPKEGFISPLMKSQTLRLRAKPWAEIQAKHVTNLNENFQVMPDPFLNNKSLMNYKTVSIFDGLVFLKKNIQKTMRKKLNNAFSLVKKLNHFANNGGYSFYPISLYAGQILEFLIIKNHENLYKTNLLGFITNTNLLTEMYKSILKRDVFLVHDNKSQKLSYSKTHSVFYNSATFNHQQPKYKFFIINSKTTYTNKYVSYAYKIKKPVSYKRFNHIYQLNEPKLITNWYRLNNLFCYTQMSRFLKSFQSIEAPRFLHHNQRWSNAVMNNKRVWYNSNNVPVNFSSRGCETGSVYQNREMLVSQAPMFLNKKNTVADKFESYHTRMFINKQTFLATNNKIECQNKHFLNVFPMQKQKTHYPLLNESAPYDFALLIKDIRILKLIYSLIISLKLQFLPTNRRVKQFNNGSKNSKKLFNTSLHDKTQTYTPISGPPQWTKRPTDFSQPGDAFERKPLRFLTDRREGTRFDGLNINHSKRSIKKNRENYVDQTPPLVSLQTKPWSNLQFVKKQAQEASMLKKEVQTTLPKSKNLINQQEKIASSIVNKSINWHPTYKISNTYYQIYYHQNNNFKYQSLYPKLSILGLSTFVYYLSDLRMNVVRNTQMPFWFAFQTKETKRQLSIANGTALDWYYYAILQNLTWPNLYSLKSKAIFKLLDDQPWRLKSPYLNSLSFSLIKPHLTFYYKPLLEQKKQNVQSPKTKFRHPRLDSTSSLCLERNNDRQNLKQSFLGRVSIFNRFKIDMLNKKNKIKKVSKSHFIKSYDSNFYFSNQKIKIYNVLISPLEVPTYRFLNFGFPTTPFDFAESESESNSFLLKSSQNFPSLFKNHTYPKILHLTKPCGKVTNWSCIKLINRSISDFKFSNSAINNYSFNKYNNQATTHLLHLTKPWNRIWWGMTPLATPLENLQKNQFTNKNHSNQLLVNFKSVLPINFETYQGQIQGETLFTKLKLIGNYNLLIKKKNTLFKSLILKMNSSLQPLLSTNPGININCMENQIKHPCFGISKTQVLTKTKTIPTKLPKKWNQDVILTKENQFSFLGKAPNSFSLKTQSSGDIQDFTSRLRFLKKESQNGSLKEKKCYHIPQIINLEFFRTWLFLDCVHYSHLHGFNNFQNQHKVNSNLMSRLRPLKKSVLHDTSQIGELSHKDFFTKLLQFYEYRKNFLLKKIFKQRLGLTQCNILKGRGAGQTPIYLTSQYGCKSLDAKQYERWWEPSNEWPKTQFRLSEEKPSLNYNFNMMLNTTRFCFFDLSSFNSVFTPNKTREWDPTKSTRWKENSLFNQPKLAIKNPLREMVGEIWFSAYTLLKRKVNCFYDQKHHQKIKYEFKPFGPQIKTSSTYKSFTPKTFDSRNNRIGFARDLFKTSPRRIKFRLLSIPKIFDLNDQNNSLNRIQASTHLPEDCKIVDAKPWGGRWWGNQTPINLLGPLFFSSQIRFDPLRDPSKKLAFPILRASKSQPFWNGHTRINPDDSKSEYDAFYNKTFLNNHRPLSSETLFREENLKVSSSYKALLRKAKILEDYPVPDTDPYPRDFNSTCLTLLNCGLPRPIWWNLQTSVLGQKPPKLSLFRDSFVSNNKPKKRLYSHKNKNTEANLLTWENSKNSISKTTSLPSRFVWDGNQNQFISWTDDQDQLGLSSMSNNQNKINKDAFSMRDWTKFEKNRLTNVNDNIRLSFFNPNDHSDNKNLVYEPKIESHSFSNNQETDLISQNLNLKKKNSFTSDIFRNSKSSRRSGTFNYTRNLRKLRLQYLRNFRRLRFIEYLKATYIKPEWMILSLLPVLPPDLRPVIANPRGYITGDINTHYQNVIYRNNNIEKLLDTFWIPRKFYSKTSFSNYQKATALMLSSRKSYLYLVDNLPIDKTEPLKFKNVDSPTISHPIASHNLPFLEKNRISFSQQTKPIEIFSQLSSIPLTFSYENEIPKKAFKKDNELLNLSSEICSPIAEKKPINKAMPLWQNNILHSNNNLSYKTQLTRCATPNHYFWQLERMISPMFLKFTIIPDFDLKTPFYESSKNKRSRSGKINYSNNQVLKSKNDYYFPLVFKNLKHTNQKSLAFFIPLRFSSLRKNVHVKITSCFNTETNPCLYHKQKWSNAFIDNKTFWARILNNGPWQQHLQESKCNNFSSRCATRKIINRLISKKTLGFQLHTENSFNNIYPWRINKARPCLDDKQGWPLLGPALAGCSIWAKGKPLISLTDRREGTRSDDLDLNGFVSQDQFKNWFKNGLPFIKPVSADYNLKNRYYLKADNDFLNYSCLEKPKIKILAGFPLDEAIPSDIHYKNLLKLYNHKSFFGSNIGIATGYNKIVQNYQLKTLNHESDNYLNPKVTTVLPSLETKLIRTQALHDSKPLQEMQYSLQKAVDALIDNSQKLQSNVLLRKGRPLKSLSDNLKGKEGRFRQHLLGKRVDYSGRSVIVVGPDLKLYECGIPLIMALRLFQPFLILYLIYRFKIASLLATQLIQRKHPMVINLLKKFIETWPILLNRAPTLHRMNIQAFKIRLVQGKAILLHPLVCSSYNADFDGDQMGVHVPITQQARAESWKLLWSINNSIGLASRQPLFLPSQDMVIGNYYLTAPPINPNLPSLIPEKQLPVNVYNPDSVLFDWPENFTQKFSGVAQQHKNTTLFHQLTTFSCFNEPWPIILQKMNHYFFSLEEAYQYYLNTAYRFHVNTPVWFYFANVFETSEREKAIEITINKHGNSKIISKYYEKQLKRNRILGKNAFYFNSHLNFTMAKSKSNDEFLKPSTFKNSIKKMEENFSVTLDNKKVSLFSNIKLYPIASHMLPTLEQKTPEVKTGESLDKAVILPSQTIFNRNLSPILLNQIIRSTFGRIEFYYEAFQVSRSEFIKTS